jgi:hypothetical protein
MDHKVTTDYTRLLGNANVKVITAPWQEGEVIVCMASLA